MDEILYNSLNAYFSALSYIGYKSYTEVYKIIVVQYIYELFDSVFKNYIADEDVKLMNELLYQFIGSTCEISFPTNCKCNCKGNSGEGISAPSIKNFKMIPDITKYTGTQNVTFTGASFNISGIDQIATGSMQLIVNNKVIKKYIEFTTTAASFSPVAVVEMNAGKSYTFKLSVEGKDGKIYYSNDYVITIEEAVTPLYMYTGNTADTPTDAEIILGTKYNYNSTKTFNTPKMESRSIWVCLPKNVTLLSMENTNFSDFLYNSETGKNLLKTREVMIDSKNYVLYYLTTIPSKSPYKTTVK